MINSLVLEVQEALLYFLLNHQMVLGTVLLVDIIRVPHVLKIPNSYQDNTPAFRGSLNVNVRT